MIEIDNTLLKQGYEYILDHPNGFLSDLDAINDCLADFFACSGIIAFGINSRAQLRYQVTPEGENIARLELISLNLRLFQMENSTI